MRLGAVLLAAGESKRFGPENKLLHVVEGELLLARVLKAFEGVELADWVVVTGHQSERVGAVARQWRWRPVFNPSYEEGMGTSVACGVRALGDVGLDGALVCVGDLPGLRGSHVAGVAEAFRGSDGKRVVQPRFEGRPGHPVCFPRRCFPELESLSGARGARGVLAKEGSRVFHLDMEDDGCVRDRDTR